MTIFLTSIKRNQKHILYGFIMFLVMFSFYMWIRPLNIINADDWTYLAYSRSALPVWKLWNPAKVFPEIFEPLLGNFAGIILFKLTGDYNLSVRLVMSVCVALFIALYVCGFSIFIERKFELGFVRHFMVITFFVSSHFLILKVNDTNNPFMFKANGYNCLINYTICLLIATLMALWIVDKNINDLASYSYGKQAFMILMVYIVIFSNMATNIVFMSILAIKYIYGIKDILKCNNKLKKVASVWHIYLIPTFFEIINLIYEYNGGRAESIEFSLKKALLQMKDDLWIIISKMVNRKMVVLDGICILIAIVVYLYHKNRKDNNSRLYMFVEIGISAIMTCMYLIALMARVGLHKIKRPENIFVLFVLWNILVCMCLSYILERCFKLEIVCLLFSFIMIFECLKGGVQRTNPQ